MKAIVTVKIKAEPNHNPQSKQIGTCPIGDNSEQICTDITGGHHAFIETGNSIFEIKGKVQRKGHHITRIEEWNEDE